MDGGRMADEAQHTVPSATFGGVVGIRAAAAVSAYEVECLVGAPSPATTVEGSTVVTGGSGPPGATNR